MTDFVIMPIPVDRYTEVCAVLGGVALLAVASTGTGNVERPSPAPSEGGASVPQDTGKSSAGNETVAQASPASAGTGATATTVASPSDGEVDAGGHPWSAELHASTKGKTKDGYWRMKVGVSRPDPLPGFPVDGAASVPATGTSSTADAGTNSATSSDATAAAGAPALTPEAGEDDEFAAFRAASDASNATDTAAAASVPARQFTDADLGALCNQAAVKLGDPSPIKEIISKYVPEGQVAHSRNIPASQRGDFAKEVEAKAGITFAG